ncbi:hypothetical protein LWI28_010203 [Acer negundo]|uniref:F-box protein n=1 Tax=Acer negundo TaxID=4023 RepID=A0AAD5JD07_ACENE|nr:hypothetical protein LWI28_010203 [Acer negundo]
MRPSPPSSLSSSSNWSELHSSILESIFQRLSLQDVLTVQSVSSHWFSLSKTLISSKSHAQSNQIPWLLMLNPPDDDQEHKQEIQDYKRVRQIDYKRHAAEFQDQDHSRCTCIGSSHGWLIFLDHKASHPFLVNPFIQQVKIQLPCLYSLLGILKIEKIIDLGEYLIKYYNQAKNLDSYTTHLRQSVLYKSVLSSNPCLGVNNLGVVVIYGRTRKLGYCNYRDSSWRGLEEGKFCPYSDIICSNNNKLYALGENACVETWDLLDGKCVPTKKMEIELCFPLKSAKILLSDSRYLYVRRLYLVENLGDLLLVVRYIGEFVNGDNKAVHEDDLMNDGDTHPSVCPYKTLFFHVYKLDFDERRWIEVESLGDSALFLGGSHSVSVCSSVDSVYKKNSVYFTDDYWDRMEEDYLYGGHDMGVFSLEDQSVEPIYQRHGGSMKIQPPPCWVAPSLW